MKTKTKIVAATAATLVAGAAIYVLPASAHERQGNIGESGSATFMQDHQDLDHATLSATVTGIPTTVTDARDAGRGAYFTAYKLDDNATAVPATEPTDGGHRMGVRPELAADGTFSDVISGTSFTGVVGLHADSDGTSVYALYPSDGSSPVLVTVTTASDGTVSATASASLSVAYSDTVAAEAPAFGPGNGMGKGPGGHHEGMRGGHGPRGMHGDADGDGPQFTMGNMTPNA